jgi:hypothetical protein
MIGGKRGFVKMEKILISIPLENYEDGVVAMARIESLKSFTIKSSYSITREDIASILGFELPEKED